jgi:hypothetical protein
MTSFENSNWRSTVDITQALGQGTINYLADKLFERTRKYFEHLDEFDLDPTRRSETSALLKHLFSRLGVKDLHQALKEAQDQFREVASSSSLPVGLLVKPNPNSHEHQRSVREPVLSYQNNWESEIHGLPADCRTSHPRLSRAGHFWFCICRRTGCAHTENHGNRYFDYYDLNSF